MIRLRIIIAALICASTLPLLAQEESIPVYETTDNDFQFRAGWAITKNLSRKVNVEWSEEFRIRDTFGAFDRMYSEIGVEYTVLDWLKLQGRYTHMLINHKGKNKTEGKSYWENRHRGTLGVTFYYKTYYNWRFSLRELAQVTFLDNSVHGYKLYDKGEKANPKWVLKSRFKAEYAFRHIPFTPYAYIEVANTLNAPNAYEITGYNEDGSQIRKKHAGNGYIEKVRTAIGCEYRFDRRNSIDVYYRFDYEFNKDINIGANSGMLKDITEETSCINIIGVNYKFKF